MFGVNDLENIIFCVMFSLVYVCRRWTDPPDYMPPQPPVTHTAVIFSTRSPDQCGFIHIHLLQRHNNHLVTPLQQDTHMIDYSHIQLMSSGAKRTGCYCNRCWWNEGLIRFTRNIFECEADELWGLAAHIQENTPTTNSLWQWFSWWGSGTPRYP